MGVLTYLNNDQLDAQEAQDRAKREAEQRQTQPLIQGLAAYVRHCWDAAKEAKHSAGVSGLSIRDRINDALRRRRGVYDAQTEQIIRQNGPSKTFLKLTDEKCHAAKSWLLDAMLPAGDKPWSVEPTTDPTIPPQEIMRLTQEATQAAMDQFLPVLQAMGWQPGMPLPPDIAQAAQGVASGMRDEVLERLRKQARKSAQDIEDAIEDAMEEGGWVEAMAAFLDDLVTYPTAFLKAPVWESGRSMEWDEQGQPIVRQKLKLVFRRLDPNNAYPSPRASSVSDGYFIERHILSRKALRDLLGVEGYDDDAIKAVLEETPDGLSDWLGLLSETERLKLLDQQQADRDPEGRIDALQFWGWVQGQQLIDYGLDAALVPDPLEEYHAEVWLIDRWVIKAELNGDPLGRRPYHSASYRPRPGSVWGEGIPEIIADIQDLCNATIRALENNLAWGSGSQVCIDTGALAEGENVTEQFPGKVWQFDLSRRTGASQPLWDFQPKLLSGELLTVYEKLSQEADNKTGIPRYAYGQTQSGGPIGTASGYSMMIQNMSKAIGAVISALDLQVTGPTVRMTFETLIMSGSIDYRGDIDVVCKGSKAILEKNNLMQKRGEFIQMVMGSSILQNLIGEEGVVELIRAHVRDLSIDAEDAIPTSDAIRRKGMMAQMQQRMLMAQQPAQGPMLTGRPLTAGQGQRPELPQGGQPAQAPDGSQGPVRAPSAAMVAQQQQGVADAPRP